MTEREPPEPRQGIDRAPFLHPGGDAQMRLLAMSAMASTFAHDLAQPLTAALNLLDASARQLRGGRDESESLSLIERAAYETRKAVEIIRRLREFTLDGTAKGKRESLREMIDRVRADLEFERPPDAELVVLVASDANHVLADRIQIELVLRNLIANALEATEGHDFRRIEVSSRNLGEEIEIAVRDAGSGLSEDICARLFEPFFSTKDHGAGLGLPICRVIVEAHGGRLWADPPATRGAAFHFTLPSATLPPVGAGSTETGAE